MYHLVVFSRTKVPLKARNVPESANRLDHVSVLSVFTAEAERRDRKQTKYKRLLIGTAALNWVHA